MTVRIINADVFAGLAQLPDESVNCCVSSPPYWNLRDYGHDGQIGNEPTPDAFVSKLVEVFREVRRVLRKDGTLWLNLGDTYNNCDKWGGGGVGKNGKQTLAPDGTVPSWAVRRKRDKIEGIKTKDLVGIPWMTAFALRADGWWLRQEIIWCLSGGTRVYARTQKGDMPMTIKDLVRLDPATVKLWNGTKWTQVLGFSETPRPDETFEIELRSGERIGCTAGHLWPTQRGNVRADELAVGDVIATCRLPEPETPREPEYLPAADVAWFVGTFLADGSYGSHGSVIQIASHADETERFSRLKRISEAFDGTFALHFHDGKAASAHIYSPVLLGVLQAYIAGENACGKRLTSRCWRRSNEFLINLLTAYLQGDGHWDAPNRRYRIGFTQNDALAADLRTLCARLGLQIRLKRYDHESQWGVFPGWRGEIRFARSAHHNCKDDGEVVSIQRSRARKFWDIGVEDEPHLFALASGVLTHNSKPNPMPESVRDRCTKAHEHIFLLSKAERYFFDAAAIRETAEKGYAGSEFNAGKTAGHQLGRASDKPRIGAKGNAKTFRGGVYTGNRAFENSEEMERDSHGNAPNETLSRNKRSVWTIATQPFPDAHFATFPEELASTCILAGCPAGGTVLDCFGGAGTTGLVADKLGRNAVLIELNKSYAAMDERRIRGDCPMFAEVVAS